MKKREMFLIIAIVLSLLVGCAPNTTNPNNTTPGTTKSNDSDLNSTDPTIDQEPVKPNQWYS